MSFDEMRIREGSIHDLQAVMCLLHMMGYEVDALQLEPRYRNALADENQQIFVAEMAGVRVQGFVHVLNVSRLGTMQFTEIGALSVDQDCRKRGIGRSLVERCEQWARSNGRNLLRVRCNPSRSDASAFYTALGFEHSKDQMVFDKPGLTEPKPSG